MENQHDTAGRPPGEVAMDAVASVVAHLEEAVEILTGRESGDGSHAYAADVMADESIEHLQRAFELVQASTAEVGRAMWFLHRQAREGVPGHGA